MSKQLDFSSIPDEAAEVDALKFGDVDGQYFCLPPAGLGQLKDPKAAAASIGLVVEIEIIPVEQYRNPCSAPKPVPTATDSSRPATPIWPIRSPSPPMTAVRQVVNW